MGARGPKAFPPNVHQLRGNPSKKSFEDLHADFQPEVFIPECPAHALPEAKKEWKRIGELLEQHGLVAEVDRAALHLYCQSWAELVYAEKHQAAAERKATAERKRVEAAGGTYEGGDGRIVVRWQNGNPIYSPYYAAARNARAQVDRFLASFGMSPSARGKVRPSDNRQGDLPLDGQPGSFGTL